MYIAMMILLAITSVFTIIGGLSAVIWTDLVQCILIIIGAIIVTATGKQDENVFEFKIKFKKHISLSLYSI